MQWRHHQASAPNCQDETELMSMGPGLTPNAEHELMMATRLPCERKYVLHGTSRAQNLYYITQIRGHATIDFEVAADGDIAVCFVPGMVFYQLNQRQLLRDKGLCPCQNTRTCKASKTLLNPKLPYLLYVVTSGIAKSPLRHSWALD